MMVEWNQQAYMDARRRRDPEPVSRTNEGNDEAKEDSTDIYSNILVITQQRTREEDD